MSWHILILYSAMSVLAKKFKNAKVLFGWSEIILIFTANSNRMVYMEHVCVWMRSWSEIELGEVHFRVKSTMSLSLETNVWWLADAKSTRASSLTQTLFFRWFIYLWYEQTLNCHIIISFYIFILLKFLTLSLFVEPFKNWSTTVS